MEDTRTVVVKCKKNKTIRYDNKKYIIDLHNKAYIFDKNNYTCCGLWDECKRSIIWNDNFSFESKNNEDNISMNINY